MVESSKAIVVAIVHEAPECVWHGLKEVHMGHIALNEIYPLRRLHFALNYELPVSVLGEERVERRRFRNVLGYEPNLDHPTTLNEKMVWLKLNDHRDFCTMVADKYRVRSYMADHFGKEYLVPLVAKLDSWRDVKREAFPDYPTILKCNSGAGTWHIVRDRNTVDYRWLQNKARIWMNLNHYYETGEWQYKNIKPCLLVEKLLMTADGKVPADIKLHFFNGECAFVYKVVDREGGNYRAFFTRDWELMPFQFTSKAKYKKIDKPIDEPRPKHLSDMIDIGTEIAKNFKYVRVDFYDMGETFYFSEITLYHGAGFNSFYPAEYGDYYADLLKL